MPRSFCTKATISADSAAFAPGTRRACEPVHVQFNADDRTTYDKAAATYAQKLAGDWFKKYRV